MVSPTRSPAAFAQLLARNRRGDFHAYLLVRVDDGALVGAANLAVIEDCELTKAWIAFMAFVPHDGRGYMTEGLGAVLSHAFGPLRLQRVEADVQRTNTRSLALLTRVGFQHERSLPRHRKIGGRWCDYERWTINAGDRRP